MSSTDLYETPPEVFDYWNRIFCFDIDLCAQPSTAKCPEYYIEEENALARNWSADGTRGWMNPPYSNPKPWVEKAMAEARAGFLTVALLPADTSTAWYQMMKNAPSAVTLLHPPGRIRFILDGKKCGSPKFGSCVAIFWPSNKKA